MFDDSWDFVKHDSFLIEKCLDNDDVVAVAVIGDDCLVLMLWLCI